jgi:hypothetical protein
LRISIENDLQLPLVLFDLPTSEHVVAAYLEHLLGLVDRRLKIDTFNLVARFICDYEVNSIKSIFALGQRSVVDSTKDDPARVPLEQIGNEGVLNGVQ